MTVVGAPPAQHRVEQAEVLFERRALRISRKVPSYQRAEAFASVLGDDAFAAPADADAHHQPEMHRERGTHFCDRTGKMVTAPAKSLPHTPSLAK
jgi:hypothetical protein